MSVTAWALMAPVLSTLCCFAMAFRQETTSQNPRCCVASLVSHGGSEKMLICSL